MSRQKKDGTKMSFFLDSEIVGRLKLYCDEKGQSQTLAVERILKEHLDKYEQGKIDAIL